MYIPCVLYKVLLYVSWTGFTDTNSCAVNKALLCYRLSSPVWDAWDHKGFFFYLFVCFIFVFSGFGVICTHIARYGRRPQIQTQNSFLFHTHPPHSLKTLLYNFQWACVFSGTHCMESDRQCSVCGTMSALWAFWFGSTLDAQPARHSPWAREGTTLTSAAATASENCTQV